jgi:hypothetical protein
VGGVLGKGLDITITESVSAAVITGNGPGYNSSAGGVAGYIQHSTVSYSQASGAVTLGATWQTGSYDYWMIYTGGLVGYSGGTNSGGSSITQSHATGAVSATAPYPYAGGLVGYNYGYNTFSGSPAELQHFLTAGGVTATSNGGQIIRSYATGSVTAASTPNSDGLPYAGGLAGYSSIGASSGANIENCYARGDVTATTESQYGWAGGLLGSNAQDSIVSKSYATGDVYVSVGPDALVYPQPGINPGAAGGGIVGVNYFTSATSIENCVALNYLIVGSAPNRVPFLLQRIAGDLGASGNQGTLTDNFGSDSMTITPVWNQDIGLNQLDGASIVAQPPQTFYTTAPLNWDFNDIWYLGPNGYPALR